MSEQGGLTQSPAALERIHQAYMRHKAAMVDAEARAMKEADAGLGSASWAFGRSNPDADQARDRCLEQAGAMANAIKALGAWSDSWWQRVTEGHGHVQDSDEVAQAQFDKARKEMEDAQRPAPPPPPAPPGSPRVLAPGEPGSRPSSTQGEV
ncbi:hypothetical protein [Segniliparus rugosus]|uniref:Uncharacterized protein n=1 Tax=Segniliparus rugosus (strain ATCC BAA-974 / DSM 45345 / CCUG 50838 / CIP 108380 / JCM 13579 / CDC 945) TaxID=679197 RepID=E5XLQ1_SEGRC|nr:hypothetical protein [Segniliparus rugosus]EFV14729.1 hypothetical protein HMPREF9336_00420 [Segniliparus rugosus ATCC BAA-974]